MKKYKYLKNEEIQNIEERSEEIQLIDTYNNVKKDLENLHRNYQFALNDEIIDYYIYQIKACQSKFDNILKQIKQNDIDIAKAI